MKPKRLHNYFSRVKSIAVIALMVLIYTANLRAQDTFTWNGSTSSEWSDANNWTVTRGGTAGTDTYPGQARTIDYVLISGGITGTPNVIATYQPTLSGTLQIGVLTITNAVGPVSGSVLTINSGATLTVRGFTGDALATPLVLLQGGNIVNNGTLNITSDKAAVNYGIICGFPKVYGTALAPQVFSYSGTGVLTITQTASTAVGCASISNTSQDPNSTYAFYFNGTTTLNMRAAGGCYAIMVKDQAQSPFIVGGTGFSVGTTVSGSANSLFSISNYSAVASKMTINSETTLSNYLNANAIPSVLIQMTNGSTTFTNKGTINISGATTSKGFALTNSATVAATLTFDNQGTVTTDIASSNQYAGIMNIAAGTTGTVEVKNSGSMTLKNTGIAANSCGYALYVAGAPPTVNITNSGTLSFSGTLSSTGGTAGKSTLNNTGTVNMLSSGLDKVIFNNNSGGVLDCKTYSVVSNTGYPVTIKTGSTLKTAHSGGLACIGGTLPNGAILDAGANYVFNGVAAQTTGSTGTTGATLTANNLEINNAAGVTLSNAVNVNGVLTMTAGILTLSTHNLTIGTLGSITPSEANIDQTSTGKIVKLSSGINDLFNSNIITYYNRENLIIKGVNARNVITLFNTNGQQLIQVIAQNDQLSIPIQKGIFILKVKNDNGIFAGKLAL